MSASSVIVIGWELLRNSITTIKNPEDTVGRSASKEQLEEMRAFVLENKAFKDICDLQIEDYGYGRFRVSMTAIGSDEIGAEQLLKAQTELRYGIYEKHGYNAHITVEINSADSVAAREYIEGVLAGFDFPLRVLSQRFNETKEYTVIMLELGIDFMDNMKKKEMEKELIERFKDALYGYRVIPQIRLSADEEHRSRKGHFGKHKSSSN